MRHCAACRPACSFILVLLILLSGFALKRPDIHPWWIWVYWMNPITVGVGSRVQDVHMLAVGLVAWHGTGHGHPCSGYT
jgi:ABC-type multidrug transport system permease subunit